MKSFHEPDEQLELYALDRLPDDAVERIEEHLILCDSCRLRLEEVATFAVTMRQALRTFPILKPWRRAGWFEGLQLKLAFGGAIAFALVLFLIASRNTAPQNLTPLAALTLSPTRGALPTAGSAKEVDLQLSEAPPGAQRTVQVFDSESKPVWSGPADGQGTTAHVRIGKPLAPGTYIVRLNVTGSEVSPEYGFIITAPPR